MHTFSGVALAACVLAGATAVSGPAAAADLAAPTVRSPDDLPAPQVRRATPLPKASPSAEERSQAGSATPALPGVGPQHMADLPADTTQVLIASTPKTGDDDARIAFYTLDDGRWREERSFKGHNAVKGWTDTSKKREGDLRTPAGVFALTDAGGYLPDPGTKMPYTRDRSLKNGAAGAYGPRYANVFDYVLAINYNRKTGVSPNEKTRPQGWDKGGGIWLHLDHDDGTHGCVTLKRADLKWVLRQLDPQASPQIIMGAAPDIAK